MWLLGKHYPHASLRDLFQNSDKEILSDCLSRLWFRYRRGFAHIGNSFYTNDIGWGCMHRTAQMMIGQALIFHYLGRDWRLSADIPDKLYEIIRLFADTPDSCYSIHQLSLTGDKRVGEWYGPSAISFAFKGLVEKNQSDLTVYVSDDGLIYKDEVIKLTENWKKSVIIIVPLRLGLDKIPETYYESIRRVFMMSSTLGIAGGRPSSSLYFFAVEGTTLLYLDPHLVHDVVDTSTPTFDVTSHFPSDKSIFQTDFANVDPSMGCGFYCRNDKDFDTFAEEVKEANEKCPSFFFTLKDTREIVEADSCDWPDDFDF